MGIGKGKLLLFGEHAAVYGHPAVGVQLAEQLEIRLEPLRDGWVIEGIPDNAIDIVRQAFVLAGRLVGREIVGARVTLSGTLPTSVGFGSSAALCVAVLRSLDQGGTLGDSRALWQAAHELEHLFHGTPSGIDTGLAIHPGASIVIPHPPGLPSIAPIDLPRMVLVVGAVPRTTGTAELVGGIRLLRERDPSAVDARLTRLGELSRLASRSGSAGEVGELATRAQDDLAALGLSTPVLDSALEVTNHSGALGAKLSGAGGGGAFFAVYNDEDSAQAAAVVIKKSVPELVYLSTLRVGERE